MQKGMEPDKDNWDIHELRKKAADSEYSTNEECQDAGRERRIKIPLLGLKIILVVVALMRGNDSSSNIKLKSTHGALLPDPQKGNSNNVEVVAEEEPINNSDDVAAGTAITLETLYEEIVKLRTICVSNKKFLNTIYTKVNSLELHQPNPQKIN
ncbi:hypothetical protein JTB14_029836 [Gonioctena quinquepunctata]|nr:hypothetical protein JTB14_029836 [Gonioctena quinquepunctata]